MASQLKSLLGPAAPLLTPIAASGRAVAVTALAALAVAAQQPAATAAVTDYSNNPLAPTSVSADLLGRYVFDGQVGKNPAVSSATCLAETNVANPPYNCADYITINIPSGFAISRINLDFYNAVDERAFIGFQSGSQFTADQATGASLLAFNHFGWRGLCATSYGSLLPVANANNNCIDGSNTNPVTSSTTTNLLTQLNASSPTPGYLGSGDYTFWIQQISGDSRYTITVQNVQQTPAPLPVIGAAAAFGWSRRLRRRLRSTSLG